MHLNPHTSLMNSKKRKKKKKQKRINKETNNQKIIIIITIPTFKIKPGSICLRQRWEYPILPGLFFWGC